VVVVGAIDEAAFTGAIDQLAPSTDVA